METTAQWNERLDMILAYYETSLAALDFSDSTDGEHHLRRMDEKWEAALAAYPEA